MKKINILVAVFVSLLLPSCNKFLDTMPDKRTELNRTDKIKALLVNAYPGMYISGITEHRTDNVEDTGTRYPDRNLTIRENYMWQPNSEVSGDVTKSLFDRGYGAISTANQALLAIEDLGTPEDLLPSKGEALLCRAYNHFIWLRVFSHAYNTQTSDKDLGIPYFTMPETRIGIEAPRLSVAESYARIAKDIEEALPLIDDTNYESAVLKYHFNKKAAYAFAAQLYLFYEKWEKAKHYATLAIGDNVAGTLRNLKEYSKFTKNTEWTYAFIDVDNPCNLLLLPTYSDWGNNLWNPRYSHTNAINDKQTLGSSGPWGKNLPAYGLLYGGRPTIALAKMMVLFEITNQVTQTGLPHTVFMPFTVDKTLLIRAEAEVLLGEYDAAAEDLKMFYLSKQAEPNSDYSAKAIAKFYELPETNSIENTEKAKLMLATICKPLDPLFEKPITKGLQYNLLQAVLHAKRLVSIHDGERWDDIKRYRIEIAHNVAGAKEPIVLTKDDPRRAIQVPSDMIAAGLQANPQ